MHPREFLSIAQDGTSQLPNGIPQFRVKTHGEDGAITRLDYHFTLTMVHGMKTFCWATMDNLYNDPNLTIECLRRTLRQVETERGFLPPKLFLQLDNCWRENKNNLVLNWCGSLVERGLFPHGIEISFLPRGHTHNEVDQVASRLSVALRRKDIHTKQQLFDLVRSCYPGIELKQILDVADTKGFLNPKGKESWTGSRWKRMQNIALYQHFEITAPVGEPQLRHKVDSLQQWSLPILMLHPTRKGKGPRDLAKYPDSVAKDLPSAVITSIQVCSALFVSFQMSGLMCMFVVIGVTKQMSPAAVGRGPEEPRFRLRKHEALRACAVPLGPRREVPD